MFNEGRRLIGTVMVNREKQQVQRVDESGEGPQVFSFDDLVAIHPLTSGHRSMKEVKQYMQLEIVFRPRGDPKNYTLNKVWTHIAVAHCAHVLRRWWLTAERWRSWSMNLPRLPFACAVGCGAVAGGIARL